MQPAIFKTPKQPENIRKTQKGNNLPKTKRILKMKYKLMGRPAFTCSLPGGAILPSSRQLRHCVCNLEKSYICM